MHSTHTRARSWTAHMPVTAACSAWAASLGLAAVISAAPAAAQQSAPARVSASGAASAAPASPASPVSPAAPAAPAQEAAASFDQLSSRVTIGEKLWVTDSDGRETRGRLERLTTASLTLKANGTKLFDAASVNVIRHRQHDSVKNGALIGLGVGAGMATAWCIGALADDSGDLDPAVECSEGFIFAGLGTLIGTAVDAVVPGKLTIIYRASHAPAGSNARISLSVVPVVSMHRFMLMGVVRH